MRNMSFALTTEQVRNRTKTVTRRTGWLFLKPGDLVQPVVKAQGIRKGEHIERIGGPIRVVSVRREPLERLLEWDAYASREIVAEGFPDKSGEEFVDMFCGTHTCCRPEDEVTRIEFEYVDPLTQQGGMQMEASARRVNGGD